MSHRSAREARAIARVAAEVRHEQEADAIREERFYLPTPLHVILDLPIPVDKVLPIFQRYAAEVEAPRLYPLPGEWCRWARSMLSPAARARVDALRVELRNQVG